MLLPFLLRIWFETCFAFVDQMRKKIRLAVRVTKWIFERRWVLIDLTLYAKIECIDHAGEDESMRLNYRLAPIFFPIIKMIASPKIYLEMKCIGTIMIIRYTNYSFFFVSSLSIFRVFLRHSFLVYYYSFLVSYFTQFIN